MVDLYDKLDSLFSEKVVEDKKIKSSIWRLPEVLIFQFKKLPGTDCKININYPLENLDMTKYVHDENKNKYKIFI